MDCSLWWGFMGGGVTAAGGGAAGFGGASGAALPPRRRLYAGGSGEAEGCGEEPRRDAAEVLWGSVGTVFGSRATSGGGGVAMLTIGVATAPYEGGCGTSEEGCERRHALRGQKGTRVQMGTSGLVSSRPRGRNSPGSPAHAMQLDITLLKSVCEADFADARGPPSTPVPRGLQQGSWWRSERTREEQPAGNTGRRTPSCCRR